jgi:hypothetical protein
LVNNIKHGSFRQGENAFFSKKFMTQIYGINHGIMGYTCASIQQAIMEVLCVTRSSFSVENRAGMCYPYDVECFVE